ncbi:MAG: transglycosylase SLT domain-containing protein [Bacteroidetes bacterium]|nr:transglycosylase SLT domain-containing protein [Bacteroidota bacterium]
MKSATLILTLFVFCLQPAFSNLVPHANLFGPLEGVDPETGENYYSKDEVQERLLGMPCLVSKKFDRAVEGYITGYVVRHRERAERILGRTIQYFPLFEEYLREHDMPEELKYLAVVESALNPKAVSRVGATGLWQFMETTGKHYGLEINDHIDERSDPVKSTLAAIEYLKKQYDRFGSWELALAAYNSGGGRVNRAVRRSRSKDFWKVRRYLPRETRNYVPAFIGATYLCMYYEEHKMKPQLPNLDKLLTQTIQISDYLPFQRVAQVTGLPISIIEELNPAYQKGYIPQDGRTYYLTLPTRVMSAMIDYMHLRRADQIPAGIRWAPVYAYPPPNYDPNSSYYTSRYQVKAGDDLAGLAKLFDCSQHALIAWNQLSGGEELVPGKELTLYHPLELKRFELKIDKPFAPIPTKLSMIPTSVPVSSKEGLKIPTDSAGKYLVYRSRGGECLRNIAYTYQLSLNELVELNNRIHPDEKLKKGVKIKISRE